MGQNCLLLNSQYKCPFSSLFQILSGCRNVASVDSHGANLNRDIAQRSFAATMRQLGGGVSRPLQGSEVDRTRGQTRHEDLRRADLHAQNSDSCLNPGSAAVSVVMGPKTPIRHGVCKTIDSFRWKNKTRSDRPMSRCRRMQSSSEYPKKIDETAKQSAHGDQQKSGNTPFIEKEN